MKLSNDELNELIEACKVRLLDEKGNRIIWSSPLMVSIPLDDYYDILMEVFENRKKIQTDSQCESKEE